MSAGLPPSTLRVRIAPQTLVLENGRLLVGGSPTRLLRLRPRGAETIASWRVGGTVGPERGARVLARRLLDAGLLVPDPDPGSAAELAVVVPTHGRLAQLDRCLDAVRRTAPEAALVIVDDGSPDPTALRRIGLAHGATIVTHAARRGPAAARNTGAAATDRPLIAFVDSDVVVEPGCLTRLGGAFRDPATGAVAPRVRPLVSGGHGIAGYEARRSSLDMGPRAGRVRPGAPVSYVPAATLVVRRAAYGEGFDERLQIGEDVDFVWRLGKAGWGVWYDPDVTVRHDHRTSFGQFATRRFVYASSIGPLAIRHPAALPALYVDPSVAVAVAALTGRPRLATLIAAGLTIRRRSQLRGHTSHALLLSAVLVARSSYLASRGLSHAVRRVWWPALAPALLRHRRGRILLAAAWGVLLMEAMPTRPSHAVLAVTDELIAGAGTWWSCARSRTTRPLRPALTRASGG